MARIRKTETPEIISHMNQYSNTQQTESKLEERLRALEVRSHTPCGGNSKDLSNLPPLASGKTADIYTRIKALEDRLEALIKKLS